MKSQFHKDRIEWWVGNLFTWVVGTFFVWVFWIYVADKPEAWHPIGTPIMMFFTAILVRWWERPKKKNYEFHDEWVKIGERGLAVQTVSKRKDPTRDIIDDKKPNEERPENDLYADLKKGFLDD